MKVIDVNLPILIGFALFLNAASTAANVFAFQCPDPGAFDVAPQRISPKEVRFEFTRHAGVALPWSNIGLHVTSATPICSEKANPVLHLAPPIILTNSQYGDWIITCKYYDSGAYGKSVLNEPFTQITLKHEDFKDCQVRDAQTVNCERASTASPAPAQN
jgi:hypothetical protein